MSKKDNKNMIKALPTQDLLQSPNSISKLRKHVGNVFMELRSKQIDVHDAATLAKLADTMISSSKVELDYHKFSNTPKRISFLEDDDSEIQDDN